MRHSQNKHRFNIIQFEILKATAPSQQISLTHWRAERDLATAEWPTDKAGPNRLIKEFVLQV